MASVFKEVSFANQSGSARALIYYDVALIGWKQFRRSKLYHVWSMSDGEANTLDYTLLLVW